MLLLKISSRRLKLFLSRPYTGLILKSLWVTSLNNLHRSWHFTKHCRTTSSSQTLILNNISTFISRILVGLIIDWQFNIVFCKNFHSEYECPVELSLFVHRWYLRDASCLHSQQWNHLAQLYLCKFGSGHAHFIARDISRVTFCELLF